MATYYNLYAFTRTGERVIVDQGLPHFDAELRCEYEAAFIEAMGDALTRYGDTWFDADWIPRIVMYDVNHDPFGEMMRGVVWIPEYEEL